MSKKKVEKEEILEEGGTETMEETKQEEKVEEKSEEIFTNITKLKCDYTIYKTERTKYKMPVITKCAKCNKEFTENDELYQAETEKKDKVIICKDCANKGE